MIIQVKNYKKTISEITCYYNNLINEVKENKNIGIVNEWIVDNYPTIVEKRNELNDFLASKLNQENLEENGERLHKMLHYIYTQNDYKIDYQNFFSSLSKYQSKFTMHLSYIDIALIKPISNIIILQEIRELCKREEYLAKEQNSAKDLLAKILKDGLADANLLKYVKSGKQLVERPAFIQQFLLTLNKYGTEAENVVKQLTELISEHKVNLKQLISQVQQINIDAHLKVVGLFKIIKFISSIEEETIITELSITEKVLNKDRAFAMQNVQSKREYRWKLLEKCKKEKIDELDLANKLIEHHKETGEHIGFLLFKPKKYNVRAVVYITSIIILTLALSVLLALKLSSVFILSFVFALIPVSQVIIQIINRILTKRIGPTSLFKLDYTHGIPKSDSTMVVIPTIAKDRKKIDAMYEQLEKYYLANQMDNLYFSLLLDGSESKTEFTDFDEDVKTYTKQKCDELNKKYGNQIFYFAYKARLFNPGEGTYLGWERKRGSLILFNKLLLKTLSDEDIEKYFHAETISKLKANVKYVITLDSDTELIVNSAANLIATMAHPMNKPVVNPKLNKVVRGYGILQPKVNIDVESSNRSTYVKLYGGLGGYDTYNSKVSNLYQDVFNEGSFMGKGIYDLEVFENLLDNRFPENQILSHDLLESNYLRSGFVNDIEFIDDFPSKFLNDMSRHHRWMRGDTQILPWLKRKVKNAKGESIDNPISPIGKWKIFDNLRRGFLEFSLLGILLISLFSVNSENLWWLLFIVGVIVLPVLFYIVDKLRASFNLASFTKIKPYKKFLLGMKAVIVRTFISFIILPYKAHLYLEAFFKSMYRMLISKKRMLNWLTAEEADRTLKNNIASYIKNFKPNYIFSILMIAITVVFFPNNIIPALICGVLFCIAPFVLYKVSMDSPKFTSDLNEKEKQDLKELGLKTWKFFEENLTEKNKFLIPDNYQLNREYKADLKTSATDIAFSLISIISAYELGYIEKKKCINMLTKVINSISKLEKWNGHLYNWYSLESFQPMFPYFVSSVDSGNMVACLLVVKEFLKSLGDTSLEPALTILIDEADFKRLITEENVFSIGYNTVEGELSVYNYNQFASESRLLSFVAIAKGDVDSKHWFCLDKTLTKYKNKKGLSSWGGSLFEYYMPTIFMRTYPTTLLEESYDFAYFCHKEYIEERYPTLPWGISECAYDELDNGVNYRYKTFSIPYLRLQEEIKPRIVISPYSSLLVLPQKPKSVYNNLKKFKDLDMQGKYGLYESYDTTTKNPVKAFFSHHQGMILASIANYLQNGAIQNYFHNDMRVKAFEMLTKEKLQIKPFIDLKIQKYKKINYQKETIENNIRSYMHVSALPEMSVLSNSQYTVLMNDRGNGFSRYNNIQLNRYRKVTEQDYGSFLFIKDTQTNKYWSNTYSPTNLTPDKYEVVFASDKIKYVLTKNNVITTTEIIVTESNMAEIRKITLKNLTNHDKELELTSYLEPIITENQNDVAHRTFNSLFITTEFDQNTGSLIAKKKLRCSSKNYYMLHRLFSNSFNASENKYETSRSYFLGVNQLLSKPKAINQELSNTVGTPIDPILSLRNGVVIPKHESITLYMLNCFGTSKEQVIDIANTYNSKSKVEKAIEVSSVANIVNTKQLNITGEDMQLYNIMLNYLYQTSRISITGERKVLLSKNALEKETLWKYNISGDLPIIAVTINDASRITLIKEILKAYEFLKSKGIYIDIVIINNENEEYRAYIKKEIELELYRIRTTSEFLNSPGSVYHLNGETLSENEKILFKSVSRLKFNTNKNMSLRQCLNDLQKENSASNYKEPNYQKPLKIENNENNLKYFNSFGGFDGKNYRNTNINTPTPWTNVIATPSFGTLVTNNGGGFTYAFNSQQFKLTTWTNDISALDQSEGIKINEEKFLPSVTTHGFGFTEFETKSKDYFQKLTEFVTLDDQLKLYLFSIKNISNLPKNIKLTYWINPVLGSNEETTSRYILCDSKIEDNYLQLRNVNNKYYADVLVYISSGDKLTHISENKILTKSIDISFSLNAGEEKECVFMLGAEKDENKILSNISKYGSVAVAKKELERVKEHWDKTLGKIQINTPDESLNLVLNGWYLYQTLSSRILAKAGYYQVGGAFGYRDQLQDSLNLASIYPEITKQQILKNASHQFQEGDVLHWWLEHSQFGLRSRYKDDALWLIYATYEYVQKTQDYSILKIIVPFINGDQLKNYEHEKGINYYVSMQTAKLYEHLKLAVDNTLNDLGAHGLPKMGGGDWNDGMNHVGICGQGESVWLGFFFYDILSKFIEITKIYDTNADTEIYKKACIDLKENLNVHGWDEEYYLRAYFDNGEKLGSVKSDECKIDLLSQSFAVLTGVANDEKAKQCLLLAEQKLVDNENKIVKLLTPAFKNSINYPGYIMDYPEGIRENGGQYTHSVAWYVMALIKAGKLDKAYEIYQMVNPINRTLDKTSVETYQVEPYVMAADIYSNPDNIARGGWTWYTGSAGWFYRVGIEELLGIKKRGNILEISPSVRKWDSFVVIYNHLSTRYNIKIVFNKVGDNTIIVNNKKVNEIRLIDDSKEKDVIVNIGV